MAATSSHPGPQSGWLTHPAWRLGVGVGTVAALVALTWFASAVIFPLSRDAGCNGVTLRSQVNAPAAKPAARPRIGVGELTASLRTALRGDQQVAACRDFADPFVLEDNGVFYAYSTNSDAMHVPVLSSAGLFSSGSRHDALPKVASWSNDTFGRVWAPSVLHLGASYVLYYTTAAGKQRQCISRAVGSSPAGPFVDDSTGPMICPSPKGAIDPSPFVNGNGQATLLWKDEGASAIVSQALTADGRALNGQPTTLVVADQDWEAGVVEAPTMTATDNGYTLFYSANDWQTADYAVSYAHCSAPSGPCQKPTDGPWLSSTPDAKGPGGVELFVDDRGQRWLAGHTWVGPNVGYPNGARDLFVLQLTFTNGQPVAA
jgi:hypothetical protein